MCPQSRLLVVNIFLAHFWSLNTNQSSLNTTAFLEYCCRACMTVGFSLQLWVNSFGTTINKFDLIYNIVRTSSEHKSAKNSCQQLSWLFAWNRKVVFPSTAAKLNRFNNSYRQWAMVGCLLFYKIKGPKCNILPFWCFHCCTDSILNSEFCVLFHWYNSVLVCCS